MSATPAPKGVRRGTRARLPDKVPIAIDDIRDVLVIRERDIFLLTDSTGNITAGNHHGLGLYHADTRHLSTYEFSFSHTLPVPLLSTAELGFSEEQVLTNPRMESIEGRVLPRESIEVRRQRVVDDVLEETLHITNFNVFPVTLDLCYHFDTDFADIYEVRGLSRPRRGKSHPPHVDGDVLTYSYDGLDKNHRQTRIEFWPRPTVLAPHRATYRVTLHHRETTTIKLVIALDGQNSREQARTRFDNVAAQHRRWVLSNTRIFSSNEFFNKVMDRSFADLRMLWSQDAHAQRFLAAGTPWFDTLFGRDTAIASLQTLAFHPQIAKQCLRMLAASQGKDLLPWRDEEPGKIVHEVRRGEMSAAREVPFSAYYGSVDATPLFLMLASEYFAWTADLALMEELKPSLLAALGWLATYGEIDGDGYVKYEKRSEKGLVNQGWKDSSDAIVHADGTLIQPPIALIEVQGYVYAAKRGMANILDALGDTAQADVLRKQAQALYRRFNEEFWLPEEQFYALALDGEHRPSATAASNAGHALWTGLIPRERAPFVAERLMAEDMFTGWGIRTLASTSPRFNPIGYHIGSVWPHDNAVVAMGFKKYGFDEELTEVMTALFDAACVFPYYRMPELFGGEARTPHHAPVPYPVACRPQAWAAGAFPLLLQATLGLCPNAPNKELKIVRPHLPYWLESVQVKGLRVADGHVDLLFHRPRRRTQVEVLDVGGKIKVTFPNRWPL
jgi:glycogen debranching enzyme